jgi:hypothetical protein
MSDVFYCYEIPSIGVLDGLVEAEKVVDEAMASSFDPGRSRELRIDYWRARMAARECGASGKILAGPFIFFFPGGDGSHVLKYGFLIWQERRSERTYVSSRTEMPWLDGIAKHRVCFEFDENTGGVRKLCRAEK